MTSGIYQLTFASGAIYIGQSVNCEERYAQHCDKMHKGTASQKMQKQYEIYGLPTQTILFMCHRDYLDTMEAFFINRSYHTEPNINTSIPKLDKSVDYRWLLQNEIWLQHSAASILGMVVKTHNEAAQAKKDFEELKSQYTKDLLQAKAQEEVRLGRDQKVQALLNRNWIRRLLNLQ